MGADYTTLCLAIEELARVDPRWPSPWRPRSASGPCRSGATAPESSTSAGCGRWPPASSRPRSGLTEPGGGSTPAPWPPLPPGTATRGRRDGAAGFVTAGLDRLAWSAAYAVTGRGPTVAGSRSPPSCARRHPWYRVGRAYAKVGWHASDTRELIFEGARVPVANTLGERGAGLANFLLGHPGGGPDRRGRPGHRPPPGLRRRVRQVRPRAPGLRPADRRLPGDRLQDRRHGGPGPTARLAWQRAAAKLDAGQPFKPRGRHRQAVCLRGRRHLRPRRRPGPRRLRLHGGVPRRRFYRDAKVLEIGEGTSEVMRILIARSVGLADPRTPTRIHPIPPRGHCQSHQDQHHQRQLLHRDLPSLVHRGGSARSCGWRVGSPGNPGRAEVTIG